MNAEVEVTQTDIEAAVRYRGYVEPSLVQAFARHRLSTRHPDVAGLRAALESVSSGEIVGMALGEQGTAEYAEAFKSGFAVAMELVRATLNKDNADG